VATLEIAKAEFESMEGVGGVGGVHAEAVTYANLMVPVSEPPPTN
jgi:hypothetical protein